MLRSFLHGAGLVLLVGSVAFAGEVQTALALSGVTCTACNAAVTKALKGVGGVREITVSDDRQRAVVVAEDTVPPEALVEAVARLGYGAHVVAQ